jgi:hypothetical protein
MLELFNVNLNANSKLFLRLSNFASVGEKKNYNNSKGAGYVREYLYLVFPFFDSLES